MVKKGEDGHTLVNASHQEEQTLKQFLLSGESVVYHAQDIYVTNRRIIKYSVGTWAHMTHFFYTTFEDLDLRNLEGMKAKNVINFPLLSIGIIIMLLGPLASILSVVPGIGFIGEFILQYIVIDLQAGGILFIGLIVIIFALILRDRVIEFYGHGTLIRAKHFYDEELVKVRELQRLRLKNS